jgi:hypothetical protein
LSGDCIREGNFLCEKKADGSPWGQPFCPRCEQIDGVMIKLAYDEGQRGNAICPQCKAKYRHVVVHPAHPKEIEERAKQIEEAEANRKAAIQNLEHVRDGAEAEVLRWRYHNDRRRVHASGKWFEFQNLVNMKILKVEDDEQPYYDRFFLLPEYVDDVLRNGLVTGTRERSAKSRLGIIDRTNGSRILASENL